MTTSRQKRHGYRRRGRSLSGVALALLATISLACGRSATAGFEPSNIPQPTPDQTLDAVVRGLVSPVVYGSPPPGTLIRPAATAAVVSAPTAAPPRPAATPAAAKPGGAATP
ncbi:MAG TPA: hypothetical protein VEQ11_09905, partial [Chloroflexota bacterium]|nr:hypothetical protein [Chloroflexota bacterium]